MVARTGKCRTAAAVLAVWWVVTACGGNAGTARILSWESDGNSLNVAVDTCGADLAIESLVETDDTVVLTIVYQNDERDDDCTDGISVQLARPLGERVVIDAG